MTNIEQYIQQLIALQNKNQNEQISKQELEEIATRLGFNVSEINKAKDNYVTAGNNYLKYSNYEDALKEFSQASVLDAQNPEILYALASCHKGIFHQKHQKKDKETAIEYAKKVTKIDPHHQKAFALISSFQENNTVPKEFNKQYAPPAKNNGFIVVMLGAIIAFGGIIAVGFLTFVGQSASQLTSRKGVIQNKSIATSRSITLAKVTGGIAQDKSYVWAIYYNQVYKNNTYIRQYKARIIDTQKKSIIKEITLKDDVNFMSSIYEQNEVVKDKIYFCAKNFYEVRDLKTGDITETKATIANKYTQLNEGIADIERYGGNSGWYLITTRKNEKYFYNPAENLLLEEKERNNYDRSVLVYRWYANNNKPNIETEFILMGDKTHILYNYDHLKTSSNVMDKTSWERLKNDTAHNKNQRNKNQNKVVMLQGSFLGGEMLYGDNTYFFGRYRKELEEDDTKQNNKNFVYFCADVPTGKVIWEKTFVNETSVVLANLDNVHTTKIQKMGNNITCITEYLSLSDGQAFAITMLDLKTGETLSNYAEKR